MNVTPCFPLSSGALVLQAGRGLLQGMWKGGDLVVAPSLLLLDFDVADSAWRELRDANAECAEEPAENHWHDRLDE